MTLCRHCGIEPATRPRGLGWTCYYTPGVRDQYPSTSKFAPRGFGDFYGQGKRPTFPTSAPPGSPEKVLILMQRAEQKQDLWHPQDATFGGQPSPPPPGERGGVKVYHDPVIPVEDEPAA